VTSTEAGATEQVAYLDSHEGKEQDVEQRHGDRDLRRGQGRPRDAYEVHHGVVAHHERADVPAREPRDQADEKQVLEQRLHSLEHHVLQQALEDGVRIREQRGQHEQRRQRHDDPSRNHAGSTRPRAPTDRCGVGRLARGTHLPAQWAKRYQRHYAYGCNRYFSDVRLPRPGERAAASGET
jgi:hypothetical protein